jgi:hypothetical protein
MIPRTDFGDKELPLVAGFLRGYRAWVIGAVLLRSTSMVDNFWTVGRNTAFCGTLDDIKNSRLYCGCTLCVEGRKHDLEKLSEHLTPSTNCPLCDQCGFYAMHTPAMYMEAANRYFSQSGRTLIFGSIKATGRVVIGKKGFRAQYAEIESLSDFHGEPPRRKHYARTYDVPWIEGGAEALLERFPVIPVDGVDYNTLKADPYFDCGVGVIPSGSPLITGLASWPWMTQSHRYHLGAMPPDPGGSPVPKLAPEDSDNPEMPQP